LFLIDTTHEVQFSPLPNTFCALRLAFCIVRKLLALFTVGVMVCRLLPLARGSPWVPGLVPLIGKSSVSNIAGMAWFCHRPKSPCCGLLVGGGSSVRDASFFLLPFFSTWTVVLQDLAPYCPIILLNFHIPPLLRPVVVLHCLLDSCVTPRMDVMPRAAVHLWLHLAHKSAGFLPL